jgi:hypothetical protein
VPHTEIYTYFTRPQDGSKDFHAAAKWERVELQLETAGPVAVSTRQDIEPVLSGRGILLPPDGEPIEFTLGKGDRLFIASESINRVKVIIEPIPWLEQIWLNGRALIHTLRGKRR